MVKRLKKSISYNLFLVSGNTFQAIDIVEYVSVQCYSSSHVAYADATNLASVATVLRAPQARLVLW